MKNSAIVQKMISFLTTLGRNSIPPGIVLFGGGSVEMAMVLYLIETILAVTLAAIHVKLRAPAEDAGYAGIVSSRSQVITNGRVSYRYQPSNRRTMIQNFLLFSLGFALIPGIFMIVFVILILHTNISMAAITSGAASIAAFQFVNFITEFFTYRDLTPESAGNYLNQNMSRSALIYFSVFAGMILAAFVQNWFLAPFAVLKTLADLSFVFRRK